MTFDRIIKPLSVLSRSTDLSQNHAPGLLVSVHWLAENLDQCRVLDARYYLPKHQRDARQEFLDGHIPGACFADLSTALANTESGLRNTWPSAQTVESWLRQRGIDASDRLVIYDALGLSACRIAWILDQYGHERVSVLDGGIDAWTAAGHALESGPEAPREASRYQLSKPEVGSLVSRERLLRELDSACVLDARNPLRFSGQDGSAKTGHMPGAQSRHYQLNYQGPGPTFKDLESLREDFAEILNTKGGVISTCGSGVSACVNLWVLKMLGAQNTRLYDGSWDEWHRYDSSPVERDPADTDADRVSGP